MAATKEELQERAQLVRLYEANCQIHFPTELDARFRKALMTKLGNEFSLRQPADPEAPAALGPKLPARAMGKPS
jgi:hypothetical protein